MSKAISEIIYDYLKQIGADGLCNGDYECGCGLEDGLFPCESGCAECYPAKHRKCESCGEKSTCTYRAEHDATECYYNFDEAKQDNIIDALNRRTK